MRHLALLTVLSCLAAPVVRADFSYEQTTKITGGSILNMLRIAGPFASKIREPQTSSVLLKGHRMALLRRDGAEIIDLDKEIITNVNFAKKTYSVMTFEQMRQMMQDMAQRMQGKSSEADVKFKASSRETGQTRTISGLNAKEVIFNLTMEATDAKTGNQGAMEITSDMWMAPSVPGYSEVRSFHRLMAAKLGFAPGQVGAMLPNGAQMAKGMAELYKESAKLDGIPVEQLTSVKAQGTDTQAEITPRGQEQAQDGTSNRDAAASGRLGGLAGLAGGLGGFGRRKKPNQDETAGRQDSAGNSSAQTGTLMEMTTTYSGFSSGPVDASKLEAPEGFKQVEPDTSRRGRR